MAKVILLALVMALSLSGCKIVPVVDQKVTEKDIPVYVFLAPPEVRPRPILEIEKLNKQDVSRMSPEEKAKYLNVLAQALAISIEQLTGYAGDLDDVYALYKKLANTATPVTAIDPKKLSTMDQSKLKEFFDKVSGNKK